MKQISLIVIALHLVGLLFFSIGHKQEKRPDKIVVRTHTVVHKLEKKEIAVVKPVVKRIPSKKVTPKQAPPKPIVKKSEANCDQLKQLLKQNLQKLDAADKSLVKASTQKTAPKPLCVESVAFYSPIESDYREEIAAYLKHALQLPVKGEIDIKLTLNRMGKVMVVEVSATSSDKNASFVSHELPLLSFPPFGSFFKNETTHTFSLKLKT